MNLVNVTWETEGTFFRCLHDEKPDDPRAITLRRQWFEAHRDRGLRARVLILDSGEVAGLCQYMPIEATHMIGRDLFAILCIWVHGYEHHIGNRQGNGYGRFILNEIEKDAYTSGAAGVAAWGMDFPYWNPVSFYEHMGYSRVDKDGMAVLVWKSFSPNAVPPQFLKEIGQPPSAYDKVNVTVFFNAWCLGACSQCLSARDAVEGLADLVNYIEMDTSDPEVLHAWGISNGIYIEGKPHRPYEPPLTSEALRDDILKIHLAKRGGR
ncbi:MAG: GNAT family N-acetyltransferase [Candidatus Eisenbacteria bacterium]|uniref:GNAT family N-acetyltransferase n=1 Tax=Eiseniibacteriota bacterium TaxID=2212470 RepID=A0A948RXG6_UNCEI|nr:GNAT family N-acetyltransferase [Candidatus Eisenbacteria bacterium]MBU1948703.1 GNAT family N-acetyltransferase [Candidatus Eisenbacteria bacterium]MBU2692286.1 GNAT family N-acetyltransferase [Candidatus Eisenbacteria bacterium]